MTNGPHQHVCTECQEYYDCQILTHCSRPEEWGKCDKCYLDEVTA